MSKTQQIDLGGYNLHYETGGRGDRHFLCLHGLVDTASIWNRITPALEKRGRIVRLEQRGHGSSGSPPGPYARDDLARDVIRVLDAEQIDQTILIGHSMGGIVSLQVALSYPARVAGLVLIGTTSQCKEKVADWYERIALAGERDGCKGLAQAIYGKTSKRAVSGDAQGIAHVTRMLKSLFDDPLTPKLQAMQCPVLLLVGEQDPMGPKASEIISTHLPDGLGRLETIADQGHWLHVDASKRVLELLDNWLVEQAPAST